MELRSVQHDGRHYIAAVLIGLCILHAATIWQQCFFIDEIYELTLARKPAAEILVEPDSMPPLYPLLLKAWLSLSGTDVAARLLSAAFALATTFTLWRLARDELGTESAIAIALLAAISPFLLYYAQMVRSYSLYVLLLSVALLFLLRARRSDRWQDWTGFVAAAVAGCYTHYYFSLFLISAGVVLLVERGLRRIGARALIAFVCLAAAVSPLLLLVQSDASYQLGIHNYRPLNLSAVGYTFFSFFSGYCLGPSKPELHEISGASAFQQCLPWLLVVASAAAILAYRGLFALQSKKLLWPTAAFLLLPISLAGALGQLLELTYNVRFVAPCVVPLMLLLAAGISTTWRAWSTRAAVAALAIVAAAAFCNRHYVGRYQNEDVRSACALLQANSAEHDPVFVIASYMAHAVSYYLPDHHEIVELPQPGQGGPAIASDDQIEQSFQVINDKTKGRPNWWLLYSRAFDGDQDGRFLDHLVRRGLIEQVVAPAGVRLYRASSYSTIALRGASPGALCSRNSAQSVAGFEHASQIGLPAASRIPASPPHEPRKRRPASNQPIDMPATASAKTASAIKNVFMVPVAEGP